MSAQSRRLAGILLILIPTVMYGGWTLLQMLIHDPNYMANELRQNLWRAGHAHAGVLLILSLVALLYVDQANLSAGWKAIARLAIPSAAILMPAGFFLSMIRPSDTVPSELIYLTYAGVVPLALGVILLGIGLLRPPKKGDRV
jgi:hypothetical protein